MAGDAFLLVPTIFLRLYGLGALKLGLFCPKVGRTGAVHKVAAVDSLRLKAQQTHAQTLPWCPSCWEPSPPSQQNAESRSGPGCWKTRT